MLRICRGGWVSSVAAIAFVLVVLVVADCSAGARAPATSRAGAVPNLPASTEDTAAVSAIFGSGTRLVDAMLKTPAGSASAPYAFWFVQAEATPTVGTVARAIEFESSKYSGARADVYLRVGLPPRSLRGQDMSHTVVLIWNPTDAIHRSYMYSGNLAPHELKVSISEISLGVGLGMEGTETVIPGVTARSLREAASSTGGLAARIRTATGLP